MTSAIEASCAGFKDMADGTVRFFFDVEPRHASDALALFRVRGTAAALAALKPLHQQAEQEPIKRERMGPLCEWAVYRCKEAGFRQWIRPVYDKVMGGDGSGYGDVSPKDVGGEEAYSAHAIKVICEIRSRKDLDTDAQAGRVFKRMVMEPYAAWLKATEAEGTA